MARLLSYRLLDEACTADDLVTVTERAQVGENCVKDTKEEEDHTANNVSNFGGDPVTQLNLKNVRKFVFVILYSKICAVLDILRKFN